MLLTNEPGVLYFVKGTLNITLSYKCSVHLSNAKHNGFIARDYILTIRCINQHKLRHVAIMISLTLMF